MLTPTLDLRRSSCFITCLFGCLAGAVAGTPRAAGAETIQIEDWLLLEPQTFAAPAFRSEDESKKVSAAEALLQQSILDVAELTPVPDAVIEWPFGGSRRWRTATESDPLDLENAGENPSEDDNEAENTDGADRQARVAFAAFYIVADEFSKAKLSFETEELLSVFIDGTAVAGLARKKSHDGTDEGEGQEDSETSENDSPHSVSASLEFTQGHHIVIAKVVSGTQENVERPWTLRARLEEVEGSPFLLRALGTMPARRLEIDDLTDARAVSSIHLSADGSLLAIRYQHPAVPVPSGSDWFEIRRAADGALLKTLRGKSAYRAFQWSPVGRAFSYATKDDDKTTLWIERLEEGTAEPLIEDAHIGRHAWTPDGRTIIYTVTTKAKKDKIGVQRMRGLPDRWRNFRDRSHLFQIHVESKSRRQLTSGPLTTSLEDVHPEGRHALLTRRIYHYDSRPFSSTELFELDLQTLETRKLRVGPWLHGATYSPDGERVLVLAGPSGFGTVGHNVEAGQIPNEYDTQAYLLSRNGEEVTPITKTFAPSIGWAKWSHDGSIFFRASDESYVRLYRFDPVNEGFTEVPTEVETIDHFVLARNAPRLAYFGSSATRPTGVYTANVASTVASRHVVTPDADRFESIELGRVEPWDFEASDGTTIRGRVYYPPEFDAKRRYPCIVYYYGGTSPTTRSFGGRYPKQLWAAKGYVVYVLQPSGAYGFGQEFSARHVNNWGNTVADEIISGTKKFLADHTFVDPKRVGCIGASYGGFMTLLLTTRTDIYGAAVSHAGISSLSSYWGEGWWGYLYSSVATADSFPWNRRDLYVEQSALFHADKITTSILLLHGTADTNVPPGESEQMYTALKVLGKEVEYVRFEGEDHWILEREKRKKWVATIVAWFDRELKERPAYWDSLYPAETE